MSLVSYEEALKNVSDARSKLSLNGQELIGNWLSLPENNPIAASLISDDYFVRLRELRTAIYRLDEYMASKIIDKQNNKSG